MSGLTEEQRVLYNQLQNAIGDFVEGFAKGFNDKIKEKHDVVKFDGTPPEDKQMLFDELGDFVESFAKGFAKGFNDKMKEKHEIETKQVTNKAIGIGITCGAIAALAVGVGCGVAGVQLSVLAIVGIAVAAALAVGIVAGVITYAISKPSNKLGSVDKILEKPYKSSNKIEKTHKNLSSFIKSGKNAPKIFNFTKKTLNQMTFFVDMLIVIPLHFSIPFWRNNHCTSLVFKTCNKGIAIVALVSYYSRVIDTFG